MKQEIEWQHTSHQSSSKKRIVFSVKLRKRLPNQSKQVTRARRHTEPATIKELDVIKIDKPLSKLQQLKRQLKIERELKQNQLSLKSGLTFNEDDQKKKEIYFCNTSLSQSNSVKQSLTQAELAAQIPPYPPQQIRNKSRSAIQNNQPCLISCPQTQCNPQPSNQKYNFSISPEQQQINMNSFKSPPSWEDYVHHFPYSQKQYQQPLPIGMRPIDGPFQIGQRIPLQGNHIIHNPEQYPQQIHNQPPVFQKAHSWIVNDPNIQYGGQETDPRNVSNQIKMNSFSSRNRSQSYSQYQTNYYPQQGIPQIIGSNYNNNYQSNFNNQQYQYQQPQVIDEEIVKGKQENMYQRQSTPNTVSSTPPFQNRLQNYTSSTEPQDVADFFLDKTADDDDFTEGICASKIAQKDNQLLYYQQQQHEEQLHEQLPQQEEQLKRYQKYRNCEDEVLFQKEEIGNNLQEETFQNSDTFTQNCFQPHLAVYHKNLLAKNLNFSQDELNSTDNYFD